MNGRLVFVCKTKDGISVYADLLDVRRACARCRYWVSCRGRDIKTVVGCDAAFRELTEMNAGMLYVRENADRD